MLVTQENQKGEEKKETKKKATLPAAKNKGTHSAKAAKKKEASAEKEILRVAKDNVKKTNEKEKTNEKQVGNELIDISVEFFKRKKENKFKCTYVIDGERIQVTQAPDDVMTDLEECSDKSKQLLENFLKKHDLKDIYDTSWYAPKEAKSDGMLDIVASTITCKNSYHRNYVNYTIQLENAKDCANGTTKVGIRCFFCGVMFKDNNEDNNENVFVPGKGVDKCCFICGNFKQPTWCRTGLCASCRNKEITNDESTVGARRSKRSRSS